MTPSRNSWTPALALALLALAALALLAAGALQVRADYLTRGIPGGLPGPVAHGGAELGINVYPLGATEAEIEAALSGISDLGACCVKQTFPYTSDFDWETADNLVRAAAEYDLELAALLDGDPADGFAPPQDAVAFAGWAAAFAARYGSTVDHYIIWDEPNLAAHWGGQPANPNEYAALLNATAVAVRQADAGAVIVAAPLAPTTERGPQNLADDRYLQALYEAGAAAAFDVAAAKPYGFDSSPEDRTVNPDRT